MGEGLLNPGKTRRANSPADKEGDISNELTPGTFLKSYDNG